MVNLQDNYYKGYFLVYVFLWLKNIVIPNQNVIASIYSKGFVAEG